MKELLTGNISRKLLQLSWPLLGMSLLQQGYNLADAVIIGKFLGTEAFASTGISGTLMNLFLFILNGFCIGLSILFAQLYGKGDFRGLRRGLFTAFAYGCAGTACLSLAAIGLLPLMLRGIGTPEDLFPYCEEYLLIIFPGLPAIYLYNLGAAILRSLGDVKASMYILAGSVILNGVLALGLIAVAQWGIAGGGWATVIAQAAAAFACLLYLYWKMPSLRITRTDIGWHPDMLRRILHFGSVTALQESNLYIGKLLIQGAVNPLGTAAIAAYAAALRLESFTNSFGGSVSQALAVLTSQNYGAGNERRVHASFWKGWRILMAMYLVLAAVMYFGANDLLSLFIDEPNTDFYEMGNTYMKIIAFCYVLCFTGDAQVGWLQGIGHLGIPFLGTTIQITVRTLLAYLLVTDGGLAAIAWATGIGWVFLVIINGLTVRWERRKLAAKNEEIGGSVDEAVRIS